MKKLYVIIVFLLMLLLGLFMSAQSHEFAHQAIYTSDNINSTINYEWYIFPSSTTAESICKTESCEIGQNNVEAFGYQIDALTVNLWIMSGFFMLFMLLRRE